MQETEETYKEEKAIVTTKAHGSGYFQYFRILPAVPIKKFEGSTQTEPVSSTLVEATLAAVISVAEEITPNKAEPSVVSALAGKQITTTRLQTLGSAGSSNISQTKGQNTVSKPPP